MISIFEAKVRNLGGPYADGTPKLEINLPVRRAAGIPFRFDEQVSITLKVAGEEYDAKVHATSRHTDVWVSPTLHDRNGVRHTLGRALTDAGFQANDRVRLSVNACSVEVLSDGLNSRI